MTRRAGGSNRVSILLPFAIISIGLGALAWRSYNLSVNTEIGATTLAVQYAGFAAEITARRVDAAVAAELTAASDEWQQVERRVGDPTFNSLRDWGRRYDWILAAVYLPDHDPASSVFYSAERSPETRANPQTREFFTSTGTVRFTYDPEILLSEVQEVLRSNPISGARAVRGLAIRQEADVTIIRNARRGLENLSDGFAFVAPLAEPLPSFGIRAVVRTAYVGGKGWQNQRVVSLWVSLCALILMGLGALLALRGMRKETETMKLRGALVANVSHELRTPLSMIRLGAETLMRGKVKDNERKEIEEQILREVLLLSHLVENVLDVARIQNRSTKALAFTPVQPRDLIRMLLTTYDSWIRSRGFEVRVQLDDAVVAQMWDRDAVSRALLNLIDNAIKYSGDEKVIDVILRQTADHVIVEVKDRGIGIASRDAARIFEPYYRAQFSDTTTRRGAGLGLTLVQQIVASHGGRVEVESARGAGSNFRLLFPRVASEEDAVPSIGHAREAF